MDELNPRTAAKSSKSAKKKTAGSDLSSARGSEERQSLPPGRGLKRGRDNEIEKVGSPISSNSSLSQKPPRKMKPSKKVLESMEAREFLSSHPQKRNKVARRLSEKPHQLEPPPINEVRRRSDSSREQMQETPDPTTNKPNASNPTFLSSLAVEVNRGARDIDVEFWTEEAALLDVDFLYDSTINAANHPEALETYTSPANVDKSPPKKRNRTEKYIPLDQLPESVLMNRVSKMLRHKAKAIGEGPDPPWPNGPPRGPQRHPKWLYTLHVDSHNHTKLAFYAEALPTDNPVIAGFAPENPPSDLVRRPDSFSPTSKKRTVKTARSKDVLPFEEPARRWRRTRSSSKSDNESLQTTAQEKYNDLEKGVQIDDPGAKDAAHNGPQPSKYTIQAKELSHGFRLPKEQLEVPDSEEDTNEDLEQEEHFHARPAVKIEIPDHLKAILVDDWENVTKNLSLVPIPADHPVSEILSTYFEEEKGKRRLGSAEADLLEEVVQGTRDYFEQCLGKLLLYRFEREQYFRLHQAMEAGKDEFEGRLLKDKKIADIYGAEHLCRLFGKFLPQ